MICNRRCNRDTANSCVSVAPPSDNCELLQMFFYNLSPNILQSYYGYWINYFSIHIKILEICFRHVNSIPRERLGTLLQCVAVIINVGINLLQFVDLRSFRNVFVVAAALFFGVALPGWLCQKDNHKYLATGIIFTFHCNTFHSNVIRVRINLGLYVLVLQCRNYT